MASGQTISKVGKRETKSKTIRGGVGIGLLRFTVQRHVWRENPFVFAILLSVLVGRVILVSVNVG